MKKKAITPIFISSLLLSVSLASNAIDTNTVITKNIVTNTIANSDDSAFYTLYDEMALALSSHDKALLPNIESISSIKVTYKSSSSLSSSALKSTVKAFNRSPKLGDEKSYTTCHSDEYDFSYQTKTTQRYMYRTDSNGDGKRDSNPGWVITRVDNVQLSYSCNL